MKGRRPKPTQLRLITGNPGHRPLNKAEPKPIRAAPTPPPELSTEARQIWDEIAPGLLEIGILTEAGGLGLAMLCDSISDYRNAKAVLEAAGGSYYKTKNSSGDTILKLHPAAKVLRESDRMIKAWLGEFGGTPASRTRVVL